LKTFYKYLVYLLILNILIVIAGFLILKIVNAGFRLTDLAILALSFSMITVILLFIFFRGQMKDPGNRTIYVMLSVSLKFLMEIVLALLWFFVGKKTSVSSLLLFFMLYLAFTLFSTFTMLKTLKTNSL
jgi:hypothetical protein